MAGDEQRLLFSDFFTAKTRRRIVQDRVPIGFLPVSDPTPSLAQTDFASTASAPLQVDIEPRTYTVRELIGSIRRQVEESFAGQLSVEGEVSNCRPAPSGHLYFTLKDGDAQLPVVLFRREAQMLRFRVKDGIAVKVRGRISLYESRGQLQLVADRVEEQGTGALQRAFEELRGRLLAEGLFNQVKRPLPAFPHCIGLVTSPSGAVIQDILNIVRRRHARLNLLIYPAVMQGENCARTVSAGLRWFNRNPGRVDMIVIARGGGSLEDLAGFNDEGLARVIAASALPVVSAIGHETDTTIADFVADLRAPTPSAAAELITAAQHRIEERVEALERRVRRAGQYQMMLTRQRLARLSADQVLWRLRDAIGQREQRLDELRFRLQAAWARGAYARANRFTRLERQVRRYDPGILLSAARHGLAMAEETLQRAMAGRMSRRQALLERLQGQLQALSPLAVLQRGYAIVYGADGGILRRAQDSAMKEQIRVRLAHGMLKAIVAETE